jgi:hypothetical protein
LTLLAHLSGAYWREKESCGVSGLVFRRWQ